MAAGGGSTRGEERDGRNSVSREAVHSGASINAGLAVGSRRAGRGAWPKVDFGNEGETNNVNQRSGRSNAWFGGEASVNNLGLHHRRLSDQSIEENASQHP